MSNFSFIRGSNVCEFLPQPDPAVWRGQSCQPIGHSGQPRRYLPSGQPHNRHPPFQLSVWRKNAITLGDFSEIFRRTSHTNQARMKELGILLQPRWRVALRSTEIKIIATRAASSGLSCFKPSAVDASEVGQISGQKV